MEAALQRKSEKMGKMERLLLCNLVIELKDMLESRKTWNDHSSKGEDAGRKFWKDLISMGPLST